MQGLIDFSFQHARPSLAARGTHTNHRLSIIWGVLGELRSLMGQGRITPFTCPNFVYETYVL